MSDELVQSDKQTDTKKERREARKISNRCKKGEGRGKSGRRLQIDGGKEGQGVVGWKF